MGRPKRVRCRRREWSKGNRRRVDSSSLLQLSFLPNSPLTPQTRPRTMAKSKSSASSATRKKHAKKALTAEVDDDGASTSTAPVPAQRGQKKVKKSRFEPKIKSYTPPPAAPKGAPDPVDLYLNGGADVDAELVVVLRRLGKRDEATIAKGLEGLEAWVREVIKEEQSPVEVGDEWKLEGRRDEVVSSMAVWVRSSALSRLRASTS